MSLLECRIIGNLMRRSTDRLIPTILNCNRMLRKVDRLIPQTWVGLAALEPRQFMSVTPWYGADPTEDDGHDHESYEGYELHFSPFTFPEPAGSLGDGSTGTSSAPSYTANGVPIFHSLIGASATLYLDFDGHFESTWGSYRNVTSPAYNIDSTAGFSSTELSRIEEIWSRVAEDYSPFNIDVTTEPPGSFANGAALRVVIGGSSSDWYGASAGGVSYINSFTNSIVNTAYVFPNQLGNGAAKYVAEAASHEAGHGFGLDHQSSWSGSTKTSEYNAGGGGWAPIMGNSYSQSLSTWYNGRNAYGNAQDDLAVLSRSQNGFGYRADDHGNNLPSASSLLLTGTSVTGRGVITQSTDLDTFFFDAAAGPVSLNVGVAAYGPNLDVRLSLFDSLGALVAYADPSSTLGAAINTTVNAGRYFLQVATTGIYGYLGQFSVNGSIVPGEAPPTPTAPEVAVNHGTSAVNDGQTQPIDFGSVSVGSTGTTHTFTVSNTGNGTLTLGSLNLPSGFTLLDGLPTSLAPGASDSFTVQMDTSTAGSKSGVVSFTSNDGDESTFDFAVSGSVNAPVSAFNLSFDGSRPASFTDANGDTVTLTLKGRGSGTVTLDAAGGVNASTINLTGTNGKSSLTITTGSGDTTVGNITVSGSLSQLYAPTTHLTGNLTVTGTIKSLVMGNAAAPAAGQQTISLGAGRLRGGTAISFGNLEDVTLNSGTAIRLLTVDSWTDTGGEVDQITAPRIHNITHLRNFDAALSTTAPAARRSFSMDAVAKDDREERPTDDRFDALLAVKALEL